MTIFNVNKEKNISLTNITYISTKIYKYSTSIVTTVLELNVKNDFLILTISFQTKTMTTSHYSLLALKRTPLELPLKAAPLLHPRIP